jgi:DNA-binding response OmpR family regulator
MNKKILIVEDDPAIVDSMQMLLEMEGYEVIAITNANKMHTIKDIFPDVILLDIWMSGQDGRDTAKYLKRHDDTKTIPIIMVSASKDIEKSAKEAGADDYLAKPFEMEELLSKVNKHIR